jgi:hypothetical protein
MIRKPPRSRKPAYALAVAIAIMLIIIGFAALLGQLAFEEIRRERQAVLETHADQLIASAQAWSRRNATRLSESPIELPTGDLLPDGWTAMVRLSRYTDPAGGPLVSCEIEINAHARRLRRHVSWPLPSAAPSTP